LKVRNVAFDLVIHAYVLANPHPIRSATGSAMARLTFSEPLCGHCSRQLALSSHSPGLPESPQVHLAAGGFKKRLTQRQHEAAYRAAKRAEKRAAQQEMDLSEDDPEFNNPSPGDD
jgi:hypothetical protein